MFLMFRMQKDRRRQFRVEQWCRNWNVEENSFYERKNKLIDQNLKNENIDLVIVTIEIVVEFATNCTYK